MAAGNPYGSFLGDLNARDVISATAHNLIHLADRIGSRGFERSYAPGKWTARIILCHLADCEIAFGFRIRQALAEDNHVVQTFDQDAWAQSYGNPSFHAQTALQVFSDLRGWNLVLINSLPPDSFRRRFRHPERGEMTLQSFIELIAGHDLNHLRQLETIAAEVERSES
jgi:DinB superfamily